MATTPLHGHGQEQDYQAFGQALGVVLADTGAEQLICPLARTTIRSEIRPSYSQDIDNKGSAPAGAQLSNSVVEPLRAYRRARLCEGTEHQAYPSAQANRLRRRRLGQLERPPIDHRLCNRVWGHSSMGVALPEVRGLKLY